MTDSQKWFFLVGAALCAVLLYTLSPILTPFLVSAVLAYLGDPVADKLQKWGLSRTAAVSVCFAVLTLVFAIILLIVAPMLVNQIKVLSALLPEISNWMRTVALPVVNERTGLALETWNLSALSNEIDWASTGGIARTLVDSITSSSLALVGFVANLLLIPVVTFYLLRDWDVLIERIGLLIPRKYIATASKLASECHSVLGAFIRGQLIVMVALGFIYSTGLSLLGLKLGLVIGLIAGVGSLVPYLGTILGVGLALVAAFFQFDSIWPIVGVAAVFMVGQVLEGSVLTPLLVGDRIGLHPVAVIFAVLAGGQLFGFTGVLLALPAAAVIMVLLRHMHSNYKISRLYGGKSEPSE